MKEVGLYQAKTQLSALVAEVAATGDGIALTKHARWSQRFIPRQTKHPSGDASSRPSFGWHRISIRTRLALKISGPLKPRQHSLLNPSQPTKPSVNDDERIGRRHECPVVFCSGTLKATETGGPIDRGFITQVCRFDGQSLGDLHQGQFGQIEFPSSRRS